MSPCCIYELQVTLVQQQLPSQGKMCASDLAMLLGIIVTGFLSSLYGIAHAHVCPCKQKQR